MSQQINLYSPIFRRQKKYFSAATMAQSALVILVAVAALAFYARLQVQALDRQGRASQSLLKTTTDELKATTARATGEDQVKALEARLEQSKAQLAEREQLVEALDRLSGEGRPTHSDYLRAFARHAMDGVWLDEIAVDNERGDLRITGHALRADLVPAYLEQLRKEPLLQGRGFNRLDITASKAPAGEADAKGRPASMVDFTLGSSGEATQ